MPMLRLLQLGLVLFACTPGHQGAHAETASAKEKPFQAYREMAAKEALAGVTQAQDGASGEQTQTKVSMAGGTIYYFISVFVSIEVHVYISTCMSEGTFHLASPFIPPPEYLHSRVIYTPFSFSPSPSFVCDSLGASWLSWQACFFPAGEKEWRHRCIGAL